MRSITVSGVEFKWPGLDTELVKVAEAELPTIEKVTEHAKQKKLCVQAGGACGVFPYFLAKQFEKVITLEPCARNFAFLDINTRHMDNLIKINAPIGDGKKIVGIERNTYNCGAQKVTKDGKMVTVAVDGMDLSAFDAFVLDVEGYEVEALRGAERSIEKYAPVVSIEVNGLDEVLGLGKDAAVKWLEQRGYKEVERHRRDVIYAK
jgi:FkbM family methyltransferase